MLFACASVGTNCDVRGAQWPVLCQVQEEEEEEEGVSRLTGLSQTRPPVADVTLRLRAIGNIKPCSKRWCQCDR